MENHHFVWVNPLFLWPCSIAFCMFTRRYSARPPSSSRRPLVRPVAVTAHSPQGITVHPKADQLLKVRHVYVKHPPMHGPNDVEIPY
jgi:hypothetical protein